MSTPAQKHAQLEVDAHNFSAALQDGALDACLRHIERQAGIGQPDPLLTCKLAEALLHRRRREDALACMRRIAPHIADDPALLRICAWVFSKKHRVQLEILVIVDLSHHLSPHSINPVLSSTRPHQKITACGGSLRAH